MSKENILLAQSSQPSQGVGIDVSTLPQNVVADSDKIESLVSWMIGLAAAIAVLIIIIAGIKYITSSGDPQSVAGAKKAILYSVIGLAICGLAWVIVSFVITET